MHERETQRSLPLGKNVKLNGCVLMEFCVVDEGQFSFLHSSHILTAMNFRSAKLEGCILGKNMHVGITAELVRCIMQAWDKGKIWSMIVNKYYSNLINF